MKDSRQINGIIIDGEVYELDPPIDCGECKMKKICDETEDAPYVFPKLFNGKCGFRFSQTSTDKIHKE